MTMRRRALRRARGQAMVEFVLVAPLFFFVLLATVDGGLLLFANGSANHSASVGEITLADEGTLFSADSDALSRITSTGIGIDSITGIDEIDIYLLDQCINNVPAPQCNGVADGTLIPRPQSDTTHYNRYCYNNSCTSSSLWQPQDRSDSASSLTNMGLTIYYHYNYLAIKFPTIHLSQTRYFRIEPRNP